MNAQTIEFLSCCFNGIDKVWNIILQQRMKNVQSLRVFTLNYSGINYSPFQYYKCSKDEDNWKQLEQIGIYFKETLKQFINTQELFIQSRKKDLKQFKWSFKQIDKQKLKCRYSPIHCYQKIQNQQNKQSQLSNNEKKYQQSQKLYAGLYVQQNCLKLDSMKQFLKKSENLFKQIDNEQGSKIKRSIQKQKQKQKQNKGTVDEVLSQKIKKCQYFDLICYISILKYISFTQHSKFRLNYNYDLQDCLQSSHQILNQSSKGKIISKNWRDQYDKIANESIIKDDKPQAYQNIKEIIKNKMPQAYKDLMQKYHNYNVIDQQLIKLKRVLINYSYDVIFLQQISSKLIDYFQNIKILQNCIINPNKVEIQKKQNKNVQNSNGSQNKKDNQIIKSKYKVYKNDKNDCAILISTKSSFLNQYERIEETETQLQNRILDFLNSLSNSFQNYCLQKYKNKSESDKNKLLQQIISFKYHQKEQKYPQQKVKFWKQWFQELTNFICLKSKKQKQKYLVLMSVHLSSSQQLKIMQTAIIGQIIYYMNSQSIKFIIGGNFNTFMRAYDFDGTKSQKGFFDFFQYQLSYSLLSRFKMHERDISSYPLHPSIITVKKKRTALQAQWQKSNELMQSCWDNIITNYKINESKSYIKIISEMESETKLRSQYIPLSSHPFDHFLVEAQIIINTIKQTQPIQELKVLSVMTLNYSGINTNPFEYIKINKFKSQKMLQAKQQQYYDKKLQNISQLSNILVYILLLEKNIQQKQNKQQLEKYQAIIQIFKKPSNQIKQKQQQIKKLSSELLKDFKWDVGSIDKSCQNKRYSPLYCSSQKQLNHKVVGTDRIVKKKVDVEQESDQEDYPIYQEHYKFLTFEQFKERWISDWNQNKLSQQFGSKSKGNSQIFLKQILNCFKFDYYCFLALKIYFSTQSNFYDKDNFLDAVQNMKKQKLQYQINQAGLSANIQGKQSNNLRIRFTKQSYQKQQIRRIYYNADNYAQLMKCSFASVNEDHQFNILFNYLTKCKQNNIIFLQQINEQLVKKLQSSTNQNILKYHICFAKGQKFQNTSLILIKKTFPFQPKIHIKSKWKPVASKYPNQFFRSTMEVKLKNIKDFFVDYVKKKVNQEEVINQASQIFKKGVLFWANKMVFSELQQIDSVTNNKRSMLIASVHLSSEKHKNYVEFQLLGFLIYYVRQEFDYFIFGGDFNRQITAINKKRQLRFEAVAQYIKQNGGEQNDTKLQLSEYLFPNQDQTPTSIKKRTMMQAQFNDGNDEKKHCVDYIFTNLKISNQTFRKFQNNQLVKIGQSKQLKLHPKLPTEQHPFDHFAVKVDIVVKKIKLA